MPKSVIVLSGSMPILLSIGSDVRQAPVSRPLSSWVTCGVEGQVAPIKLESVEQRMYTELNYMGTRSSVKLEFQRWTKAKVRVHCV